MSDNQHAAPAAAVGVLGLLLVLGRSCDAMLTPARVVDDLPIPSVATRLDDLGDGVHGASKGVDLHASIGADEVIRRAREAEEEAVAGGRVTGEDIETFYSHIHPRVAVDLPASNPKLLVLFPRNAREYRAVYGYEPTASGEAQIRRLNRRFAREADVERLEPMGRLADALGRSDESSPLVILGHSEEEGGVLVLPTGERIGVVDVHRQCQAAGKTCIVLTCHGEDLGIQGELAPEDAFAMWQAARRENQESALTIAEFALTMREDQAVREARHKIAVSGLGVGVATGAGATYVYISRRRR